MLDIYICVLVCICDIYIFYILFFAFQSQTKPSFSLFSHASLSSKVSSAYQQGLCVLLHLFLPQLFSQPSSLFKCISQSCHLIPLKKSLVSLFLDQVKGNTTWPARLCWVYANPYAMAVLNSTSLALRAPHYSVPSVCLLPQGP